MISFNCIFIQSSEQTIWKMSMWYCVNKPEQSNIVYVWRLQCPFISNVRWKVIVKLKLLVPWVCCFNIQEQQIHSLTLEHFFFKLIFCDILSKGQIHLMSSLISCTVVRTWWSAIISGSKCNKSFVSIEAHFDLKQLCFMKLKLIKVWVWCLPFLIPTIKVHQLEVQLFPGVASNRTLALHCCSTFKFETDSLYATQKEEKMHLK